MPRVVGVEIPDDKRVVVALRYIHGIGRTSAQRILAECGIDENKRARELTEDEINRLAALPHARRLAGARVFPVPQRLLRRFSVVDDALEDHDHAARIARLPDVSSKGDACSSGFCDIGGHLEYLPARG